jgi:hypothetical protein
MSTPAKLKPTGGIEGTMRAHSDEARYQSRKHLKSAIDAIKHGEDENAMAHMLDALRLLGRYEAFLDIAKDVTVYMGDDDDV